MTVYRYDDRKTPMGAVVEFVEVVHPSQDPAELPAIKPYRVYVNGTDVGLIEKDSIAVEPGDGAYEAAKVTLTLLPREVSIRAVAETPEAMSDGPVDLTAVDFRPIADAEEGGQ